jgi:hypothetical protein
MKNLLLIVLFLSVFVGCKQEIIKEETNYSYHNISHNDTLKKQMLYAVTKDSNLQMGQPVAFINNKLDTVIPFGKFQYCDMDSGSHYLCVMIAADSLNPWRYVGINQNQKVLFNIILFDFSPDPFYNSLTRIKRNGKMGYADKYGRIRISCQYDYAKWFDNGIAEVTFDAKEYLDQDEHRVVESDSWFNINTNGEIINNTP